MIDLTRARVNLRVKISSETGGYRNADVRSWLPADGSQRVRRVLCLHGLESHSGWFEHVGQALSRAGYWVQSKDRPGWGRSAGMPGDVENIEKLRRQVLADIDEATVSGFAPIILANSWGGLLAWSMVGVLLQRGCVVVLVAPGLIPHPRFSWSQKLAIFADACLAPQSLVRLGFAPIDFAKHSSTADWIASDPASRTSVSARTLMATWIMQQQARRWAPQLTVADRSRLRVVLADDDSIIDTQRTLKYFQRHQVGCQIISGSRHGIVLEHADELAQLIDHLVDRLDQRAGSLVEDFP